ncbi:hypothetical protein [Streptomyces sp. OE57]|uniref:hypothetical protein n=1 Tax=Streptomyces lacaronensis TaxID=3379885 RepID=UPI0039B78E21
MISTVLPRWAYLVAIASRAVPPGEQEKLLDRVRGYQETARQRVADLRTQLARAEEFAATLDERLTSARRP